MTLMPQVGMVIGTSIRFNSMPEESMFEMRKRLRLARKQLEELREASKVTLDEPDGETGSGEVVEPDGTPPNA
jgi:hypothetical protein